MPKATVSLEYERYELKSLEGAFIMLRPLPHGKKLRRSEQATRMMMERADDRATIELLQYNARILDYQYCIGEHNLEDDNGNLLDFSKAATVDVLDPRVGGEIDRVLDRVNGVEEDNQADFPTPVSS